MHRSMHLSMQFAVIYLLCSISISFLTNISLSGPRRTPCLKISIPPNS